MNEMLPENPNVGMFLVAGDNKTQSGIYLPNPTAGALAAIQAGEATLGWPEIRIEASPRSMSEAAILAAYHPVDNPLLGDVTSDANYDDNVTTPVPYKTINNPYQSIDIFVYADPFGIAGTDVEKRKETFLRLYGFRDVSSRTSIGNAVPADIQPIDVYIMNQYRNAILAAFSEQDGNGQYISFYVPVPGSIQDQ